MKKGVFSTIFLFVFAFTISGQVSPNPVADTEMRDGNSNRMRSLQMERVKRDASKARPKETAIEAETRFALIKEDFEGIQKLETSIIKAYTTGQTINYKKIRESAGELRRRAVRFGGNFFDSEIDIGVDEPNAKQGTSQALVKRLIIELDGAIGSLIKNPVFSGVATVDSKTLEAARLELESIVRLSQRLSLIDDK